MYYAQHQVAFDGIGNYAFSHIAHLSEHPDIQLYYFQPDYRILTKEQYQTQLSNFILDNRLDIFHFPSPMQIPFPEIILHDRLPRVRLTALVHDIIPLIYPDVYLADKNIKRLYHLQLAMLKNFDHLFTNSRFTGKDLVRIGFAPESITAIGVGCQDFFVLEQADLQEMRHLFPVDKPYVMAFNPSDYRKNAERIIQAFARAAEHSRFGANVRLLFVNQLSEAVRAKLDGLAAECGIADRVFYTGRISKSQLLRLYNRAQGLVFPSLYEGVGLPALEAMLCGTPVLTSNGSSMPEIVGDAAIQVDPHDVNQIAQGLVELVSNAALRRKLVERGFRQAERFQWTAVSNRTAAKFRELVKQAPKLKNIAEHSVANDELEDTLEQLKSDLAERYDRDRESLLNELRSDIDRTVADLYQYIDRMFEQGTIGDTHPKPSITSASRRIHERSTGHRRSKQRNRSKQKSSFKKKSSTRRRKIAKRAD